METPDHDVPAGQARGGYSVCPPMPACTNRTIEDACLDFLSRFRNVLWARPAGPSPFHDADGDGVLEVADMAAAGGTGPGAAPDRSNHHHDPTVAFDVGYIHGVRAVALPALAQDALAPDAAVLAYFVDRAIATDHVPPTTFLFLPAAMLVEGVAAAWGAQFRARADKSRHVAAAPGEAAAAAALTAAGEWVREHIVAAAAGAPGGVKRHKHTGAVYVKFAVRLRLQPAAPALAAQVPYWEALAPALRSPYVLKADVLAAVPRLAAGEFSVLAPDLGDPSAPTGAGDAVRRFTEGVSSHLGQLAATTYDILSADAQNANRYRAVDAFDNGDVGAMSEAFAAEAAALLAALRGYVVPARFAATTPDTQSQLLRASVRLLAQRAVFDALTSGGGDNATAITQAAALAAAAGVPSPTEAEDGRDDFAPLPTDRWTVIDTAAVPRSCLRGHGAAGDEPMLTVTSTDSGGTVDLFQRPRRQKGMGANADDEVRLPPYLLRPLWADFTPRAFERRRVQSRGFRAGMPAAPGAVCLLPPRLRRALRALADGGPRLWRGRLEETAQGRGIAARMEDRADEWIVERAMWMTQQLELCEKVFHESLLQL
jgi:hypothetical protein